MYPPLDGADAPGNHEHVGLRHTARLCDIISPKESARSCRCSPMHPRRHIPDGTTIHGGTGGSAANYALALIRPTMVGCVSGQRR